MAVCVCVCACVPALLARCSTLCKDYGRRANDYGLAALSYPLFPGLNPHPFQRVASAGRRRNQPSVRRGNQQVGLRCTVRQVLAACYILPKHQGSLLLVLKSFRYWMDHFPPK